MQTKARERYLVHGYMDSHYNSYGLLLGYALESILKGLWVAHGHVLATDGRLTPIRGVGEHDLLALTRAVGVKVSAAERGLIHRLSYWVKVAGRYPIPVRASDLRARRGVKPGRFSVDEWDRIRQTVGRLLNELHDQMD